MIQPTIWARGARPGTGPHDGSCRCRGHCRQCFDDLKLARAERARLRRSGMPAGLLPVLRAACSPACRSEVLIPRRLRRRLRARAFRRIRGR